MKLNYEKAQQIRNLRKQGAKVSFLASEFGVGRTQINKVLNGKAWNKPNRNRKYDYSKLGDWVYRASLKEISSVIGCSVNQAWTLRNKYRDGLIRP